MVGFLQNRMPGLLNGIPLITQALQDASNKAASVNTVGYIKTVMQMKQIGVPLHRILALSIFFASFQNNTLTKPFIFKNVFQI